MSTREQVDAIANELGYSIRQTGDKTLEFNHPSRMSPFYIIDNSPAAFDNAISVMKNESASRSNTSIARELARSAEITEWQWIRGPGLPSYWYRHDIVKVNGVDIGIIQHKKGGKKGTITCANNSCVIGSHVEWLISQAIGKGILKVPNGQMVEGKSKRNKIKLSRKQWDDIGKIAGWVKVSGKVSNCCGAEDRMTEFDGPNYSEIGICPKCKEHCVFEEEDDPRGGSK